MHERREQVSDGVYIEVGGSFSKPAILTALVSEL